MSKHSSEVPAQRLDIPVYHPTEKPNASVATSTISTHKRSGATPAFKATSLPLPESLSRALRHPIVIAVIAIAIVLSLVLAAHAGEISAQSKSDCQTVSDTSEPSSLKQGVGNGGLPISEKLIPCANLPPPKQTEAIGVIKAAETTGSSPTTARTPPDPASTLPPKVASTPKPVPAANAKSLSQMPPRQVSTVPPKRTADPVPVPPAGTNTPPSRAGALKPKLAAVTAPLPSAEAAISSQTTPDPVYTKQPKHKAAAKPGPAIDTTRATQTILANALSPILLLVAVFAGLYLLRWRRWPQSVFAYRYPSTSLMTPSDSTSALPERAGKSGNYDALCNWTAPSELVQQVSAAHPAVQAMADDEASVVSRLGARTENQDYGLICALGQGARKRILMVSADGLGGHLGGRPASFVAARAVLAAAANNAHLDTVNLMPVLLNAAESELASFAKQHFTANQCMTTCIVTVADASFYFSAWLGDGGIQLRRTDGAWISLMKPHQSPEASNIVTGLLGPCRINEWRYAIERRDPGDCLIIGSDGAMDRVEDWEAFSETPRIQISEGTNLHQAWDEWWGVAEREMPKSFDDNITAVTLATSHVSPAVVPAPLKKRWWDAGRRTRFANSV